MKTYMTVMKDCQGIAMKIVLSMVLTLAGDTGIRTVKTVVR